ncbi:CHAT domain-containing protein [Fulvivirga sp. 29W222]|uniref:CHAT domain-containing protein n=1 Tax=Fulvivirga marina TaxID=2494733 RepID=A0A937FZ86_9BACT|nr:CHAT domain-containing tetratricopeptide repeat protein [Fulvivirga marina]MBL6448724.1 CHAT domain-containing protein [Fulvivirga marina]
MRYVYIIVLCLPLVVVTQEGYGQIGKLLKDKAKNLASGDRLNLLKNAASAKLDEARNNFDSTSFSYAISLNDNSDLYDVREKGEVFLKAYSNLGKNETEKEEWEKARDLLDKGEGFYASGYYAMAERVLLASKIKYEANGLKDDVNYSKALSTLGLLYSTMGRYTTAEEYILNALDLRKADKNGYGASLNNLAVLYKETGKYNESEKLIKEASETLKTVHERESMPYAIALNNEAMLYQAMGRYGQAEKILDEAIGISANLQNEKSGNHQKFLTNQALLYQEIGQYELAENAFRGLIKLKERRFGKKHPDYAHILNNLAALYMQMGKYDEVEPLLKEAIEIYERKFGKEHRLYAGAISDLGNFYRFKEDYEASKPLLIETLEIREKILGEKHPQFVQSKENLAILYWKMRDHEKAVKLYTSALDQSLSFINEYFPPMSEAEKTKYWDKLRPRFERFYSFVSEAPDHTGSLLLKAYNYHVATKGLLLKSTNKIKQKILKSDDENLKNLYLEWLDQKETLARLYSYSQEELHEQHINRDSLERAVNDNEKLLSLQSDVFSGEYTANAIGFEEVQQKLKPGEAAVEFVRFRGFNNTFTNEVKYLVFVATKDGTEPRKVLLENGVQLEGRYFKYYNNAIHQKLVDEYSYNQYWAPIEPLLEGVKQVYLSPDGIYNQLSMNTLQKASGEYLMNDHDFYIIGSTRMLVEYQPNNSTVKSAYLIGYPEYGGNIPLLLGTKAEIANISKILATKSYKITTISDVKATETRFKAINDAKILHIATHGYFLEDNQLKGDKVFGVSIESARGNPLLRAGLLLTNAGNVISNEASQSLESDDNGILTAFEAMNMSLDKTDLVVLSACETAVGDIKAGEGVYGLQRAFLVAGADAIIMSLWKVDDNATQELMTKFYSNWLKTGNKHQAFKAAQVELKGKYKEPYYWGAFILIGS